MCICKLSSVKWRAEWLEISFLTGRYNHSLSLMSYVIIISVLNEDLRFRNNLCLLYHNYNQLLCQLPLLCQSQFNQALEEIKHSVSSWFVLSSDLSVSLISILDLILMPTLRSLGSCITSDWEFLENERSLALQRYSSRILSHTFILLLSVDFSWALRPNWLYLSRCASSWSLTSLARALWWSHSILTDRQALHSTGSSFFHEDGYNTCI